MVIVDVAREVMSQLTPKTFISISRDSFGRRYNIFLGKTFVLSDHELHLRDIGILFLPVK